VRQLNAVERAFLDHSDKIVKGKCIDHPFKRMILFVYLSSADERR
jgi:hypothetical protein